MTKRRVLQLTIVLEIPSQRCKKLGRTTDKLPQSNKAQNRVQKIVLNLRIFAAYFAGKMTVWLGPHVGELTCEGLSPAPLSLLIIDDRLLALPRILIPVPFPSARPRPAIDASCSAVTASFRPRMRATWKNMNFFPIKSKHEKASFR